MMTCDDVNIRKLYLAGYTCSVSILSSISSLINPLQGANKRPRSNLTPLASQWPRKRDPTRSESDLFIHKTYSSKLKNYYQPPLELYIYNENIMHTYNNLSCDQCIMCCSSARGCQTSSGVRTEPTICLSRGGQCNVLVGKLLFPHKQTVDNREGTETLQPSVAPQL